MKVHHEVIEYETLDLEVHDQVATLRLLNSEERSSRRVDTRSPDVHLEVGSVLSRLRLDDRVRVVVLTGSRPGQFFAPGPAGSEYESFWPSPPPAVGLPDRNWRAFLGVRVALQALTEMEKPVIAAVNGDAIGFGQSLMFACDLIVAAEDALVVDHHMGRAGEDPWGLPFSAVPGDGGAALVPLHMPPALAMEYLLLSRPFTGRELADMGTINYAVPQAEVATVVEGLVERMLSKSAYALALTKRVVKRHVAQQLNLVLDASGGYEWVTFLHFQATEANVNGLGWDAATTSAREAK